MTTHNSLYLQFELQGIWFTNMLRGISDEESHRTLAPDLNPVKWVAGHVVNARLTLAQGLGYALPYTWSPEFGKGTSFDPVKPYPAMDTLLLSWKEISDHLVSVLQNKTDEEWNQPPLFQTSIADTTRIGFAAYFAMHENFHIGQLSILRKLLGKPAGQLGRI